MAGTALAPEHFPPLSQGISPANTRSIPDNWKTLFSASDGKETSLQVSHHHIENNRFSLSEEELSQGHEEWRFSLVGHALGKRPFYGSLLAAVKRKWNFKGSLELLTMDGDFFLFKFNCQEDFDMVWSNGPCFLNGRPFLFQKCSRGFIPSKGDIKEIPLWIKLPNFPLCCWTEIGLSKAASVVGIPLAVDNLTASKTRITFARVCVLVKPDSALPDSFEIDMNGIVITQQIHYDWKPSVCHKCNTFSHADNSCPSNQTTTAQVRGRSRSRQVARRRPNQNLQQHFIAKQSNPTRTLVSGHEEEANPNLANSNLPPLHLPPSIQPSSGDPSPPNPQQIITPNPQEFISNIPPLSNPAPPLDHNPALNDLNHLPIPSPPLDELLDEMPQQDEDASWELPKRPIRPSGMTTRSAAISPARIAALANTSLHSPGDSTGSSVKQQSLNDRSGAGGQNTKKKKGKNSSSSSQ